MVPISNMFRSRTPVLKFSYNRRHTVQANVKDVKDFTESINKSINKNFNKTSKVPDNLKRQSDDLCALI